MTDPNVSSGPRDVPVYVLGLSEAHNCTAALLRDGKIVAVASEERFSRRKNDTGFPRRAVDYVTSAAGITSDQIDLVTLSYQNPYPHFGVAVDYVDEAVQESGSRHITPLRRFVHASASLVYSLGSRNAVVARALDFLERNVYETVYRPVVWPRLRHIQYRDLSKDLGVRRDRILSLDHHLCHAVSALDFAPVPDGPTLVLTLDGAGDDCCATVSVSENGTLRRIAQTPNAFSLGILYSMVTGLLGMKSGEHEYKVMGLAPYADRSGLSRVRPVFESLLQRQGLDFRGPISTRASGSRLQKALTRMRFDWVAGAIQSHAESLVTAWVTAALAHTGARNVVCAGGVFMNVKANMLVKDLPGVAHFAVCPSAGDESTAIGAAFEGYRRLTGNPPQPMDSIYLGPEYDDAEIESAMQTSGVSDRCTVERPEDIDVVTARLLAEGHIVARFQGRMEFGARALGNRSILASPSDRDVVPVLNEQIKQRDFWMPFAGSLLSETQDRYIVNRTRISSPHMMVAFETTALGRKELQAAIHPSDKTIRPQLLQERDNPRYHRLIKAFEGITGIGAVLNTSFNLHGEPIVCSPTDAFRTLLGSGLARLAIGPYLVTKE